MEEGQPCTIEEQNETSANGMWLNTREKSTYTSQARMRKASQRLLYYRAGNLQYILIRTSLYSTSSCINNLITYSLS
jgi:hypothetical protein